MLVGMISSARRDSNSVMEGFDHLLQRQRIVLDSQRSMNGADTILPAQTRRQALLGQHGVAADGFTDRCNQIQDCWSDGVGRLVAHTTFKAVRIVAIQIANMIAIQTLLARFRSLKEQKLNRR